MLTEKQIEDVIEELEGITRVTTRSVLFYAEVKEVRRLAQSAIKILKTEEPQSRDCW